MSDRKKPNRFTDFIANHSPIGRYIARNLDSDTVSKIAPESWALWEKTSEYYRGIGYRGGTRPPDAGQLLVQSPYADFYNLTWGLAPNADMPKWRWMYRARPEIRQGIDKMVTLSIGRGFAVQVIAEKKGTDEDDSDTNNQSTNKPTKGFNSFQNPNQQQGQPQQNQQQQGQPLPGQMPMGMPPKPEKSPEDKRNDDIENYANQLIDKLGMRDVLQSSVTDMLVYGEGYFEKVRTVEGEEQDYDEVNAPDSGSGMQSSQRNVTNVWAATALDEPTDKTMIQWIAEGRLVDQWLAQQRVDMPNTDVAQPFGAIKPMKKMGKLTQGADPERRALAEDPEQGDLIELKPLDPLWMRVNRDAFGNIIGWVQWGLTPIPQSVPNEKIVVMKWLPKSWAHENAYGTSILMPVARHVSMLVQAEEDMKLWFHQYAKPMLVVNAGTEEKPYPLPALQNLSQQFAGRQPNADAIVPGDVKVEVLKNAATDTATAFKEWTQYLREKIYETMGIPSMLMNLQAAGQGRGTSDTSLQAFVAYLEMVQQITGEQIMKQVIEPELMKEFGKELPQLKVIWPDILSEDRNKKVDRIVKAVGVPYMTVNEARAEAGLPPMDNPEYDELALAPAGPTMGTAPGMGAPMPPGIGANPTPALGPDNSTYKPETAPSKNPEQSESTRTGPREEQKQKQDRGNANITRKRPDWQK